MNLIFSFIAIILTFRCKGGSKNFRRESEVNLHKERIDLSRCEYAKNFPDSLSLALKNDPDIYKIVLVEVGS